MRFEEPNAFNRWDSPLFTVNPDDQLDCQQFEDALLMKATSVRPNMATLPVSAYSFTALSLNAELTCVFRKRYPLLITSTSWTESHRKS